MPLFDFECEDCGKHFEELLFDDDNDLPCCPECKSKNTRRLLTMPSPLKKNPFPYKVGPVNQAFVNNVKRVLPYAKQARQILMETGEYLATLPDEKSRKEHIDIVEKGIKEQYKPVVKKLTFSQGKLLVKLIYRECNQTSYEVVQAFLGSFKAGYYQFFAGLFGNSLKKAYDPEGDDKYTERVVRMVESGQL